MVGKQQIGSERISMQRLAGLRARVDWTADVGLISKSTVFDWELLEVLEASEDLSGGVGGQSIVAIVSLVIHWELETGIVDGMGIGREGGEGRRRRRRRKRRRRMKMLIGVAWIRHQPQRAREKQMHTSEKQSMDGDTR